VSGEGGRVGALTGIRSNGDLVRVLAASVGFNVAELATWLAILVYAYDLGGASLASVVAVVQLVPAALLAPVASAAGDVGDRRRLLLVGYLVQAAAMAATAAAVWSRLPSLTTIISTRSAKVCSISCSSPRNPVIPSPSSKAGITQLMLYLSVFLCSMNPARITG